jgi:hypothetical protein
VEENNKRYRENPQLYRTRQEINEHIFGTIKRQWGYNHTNLTGLEKLMESSLIMLVYNIKRYKHTHGTGFNSKNQELSPFIKAKLILLL